MDRGSQLLETINEKSSRACWALGNRLGFSVYLCICPGSALGGLSSCGTEVVGRLGTEGVWEPGQTWVPVMCSDLSLQS